MMRDDVGWGFWVAHWLGDRMLYATPLEDGIRLTWQWLLNNR
jgi:hypothetical protein